MADSSSSLYSYVKRHSLLSCRTDHLATLVKNHRPFMSQLNLQRKMPVHEGCVNTLAWNYNGQFILSGSDDCCLCVTRPVLCDSQEKNYQIQHKILSGHRANIFSAQFMPYSSDTKIASCSSSGSIIVTDVNSPETSGTSLFECHKHTCYEVAPIPDMANVFLSCSEDKTVRLFDLRTTQSCLGAGCQKNILIRGGYSMTTLSVNPTNPEQFLVGRSDGSGILFDRRKICKDSELSYHHQQHQPEVSNNSASNASDNNYTMTKHLERLKARGALNHPAHGAVAKFMVPGFTDTHRFTSLCFSDDGRQVLASYSSDYIYLFDTDRASNLTFNQRFSRTLDESPNGIQRRTSNLPRRTFRVRGDWSDTGPNSRPIGNSPGETRDQRQSFMSRLTRAASSLLINTPRVDEGLRAVREDPTRQEFIGVPDLLRRASLVPAEGTSSGRAEPESATDPPVSRSDTTESSRDNNETGSVGDVWVSAIVDDESDRDSEDVIDEEEDVDIEEEDDDDDDDFDGISMPDFVYNKIKPVPQESNDPRTAASTSRQDQEQNKDQDQTTNAAEASGSSSKPGGKNISPATKEKFSQSFKTALEAIMGIPSYRPKKLYKGHRNCRTAIKEATFWGTDYIMSGSDCGHVFVWDKHTSEVVMIFQADERVVNCIAPNPVHYCLATSGIDYDIKLWSTQFMQHEPLCKSKENIQKIIRINEQMIQEDLHTITMPPHFFFRVLASLASARIVEVENRNENEVFDY